MFSDRGDVFARGIGYPFCVFDIHEKVVSCNAELENLLGVSGISGMTLKNLFESSEFAPLVPGIREGLAGTQPLPQTVKIEGFPIRHYQAVVKPLSENGAVQFAVVTLADVSEKMDALQFGYKARNFYNTVFDEMPEAYFMVDDDFAVLRSNRAAQVSFSMSAERLLGFDLRRLFRSDGDTLVNRLETFKTETVKTLRLGDEDFIEGIRYDGSNFPVRVTLIRSNLAEMNAYSVIVLDLAADRERERRHIEEEKKVQGMMRNEALGKLAGKFAHDMNNVLAIIGGFCEILALTAPAEDAQSIEEIRQAVRKGASLTARTLAYTGRQQMESRQLDIGRLVALREREWRDALGEGIVLTLRLPEDKIFSQADEKMLIQVIFSLLDNCREAMPDGGDVSLVVDKARLTTDFLESRGINGGAGDFTEISIEDNGPGIPADKLPQIFDPYFSTKDPNTSSGFGLAIVYGIIKQHGGFIFCENQNKRGTRMRVLLPAIDAGTEAPGLGETEVPAIDPTMHTVLIVDDEDRILQILASTLTHAGFGVLTAANGRDAFAVIAEHGGDIDLLLTDVVMPEMNGIELTQKLLETFPSLPVVFITGYSHQIIDKHMVLRNFRIINKPFVPDEVVAAATREIALRSLRLTSENDALPEG
jgi:two-component system, cell cycle sensor histidine kinase and response regulator CckA